MLILKNAKIVIESDLRANVSFFALMNVSSRCWSPFHANECVFSRNEQQKVYCTLKYANMIRISNISFFRFCWKNGKLDWPKCARTPHGFHEFQFHDFSPSNKFKTSILNLQLSVHLPYIHQH